MWQTEVGRNSPARGANTDKCAEMEKGEHVCKVSMKGAISASLAQLLKFSRNLKWVSKYSPRECTEGIRWASWYL